MSRVSIKNEDDSNENIEDESGWTAKDRKTETEVD